MRDEEILIPIVMFSGAFAMIFGIVYLRTKQNMAMIASGMNPKSRDPRPMHRPTPYLNLKWGLLLVGSGLGFFIAYLLDNFVLYKISHDNWGNNGANVPVYFALIAIGGGLGLITSYRIEKKELLDKEIPEYRDRVGDRQAGQ